MELACCGEACTVESDCVELTERESQVCRVICNSTTPVTFGQVRDATNLHQEIVSRVVRRLVIHGLVVKTDGKYKGECSQ